MREQQGQQGRSAIGGSPVDHQPYSKFGTNWDKFLQEFGGMKPDSFVLISNVKGQPKVFTSARDNEELGYLIKNAAPQLALETTG
jgi:hypothetical protein